MLDHPSAHEVQDELAGKIFEALFEHAQNIGDIDVLGDLAASVGMNRDDVISYLKSDAGVEQVKHDVSVTLTRVRLTDLGGEMEKRMECDGRADVHRRRKTEG